MTLEWAKEYYGNFEINKEILTVEKAKEIIESGGMIYDDSITGIIFKRKRIGDTMQFYFACDKYWADTTENIFNDILQEWHEVKKKELLKS